MDHKPLFGDLIAAHDGLADALKGVDVAADLTLLLNHAGMSRAELARALGWSRARVTQVLSGHENLTVQTIAAVAQALGYTFDAVFRKAGAPAPAQPWDVQARSAPDMVSKLASRSVQDPLLRSALSLEDSADAGAKPIPAEKSARRKKRRASA